MSALNPTGWSTTPPVVGVLEYLWITKSIKNYTGTVLVSNWTTPTRISGVNGTDGTDGADGVPGADGTDGVDGVDGATGATGPSPVFQGDYSSSKTYYGTGTRVDIVKYSGSYYVARTDAGTFSNVVPTNTAKWNTFGAQFDSVATDLLFAELAYIENLGVQNLKTATTGQRIEMTAATQTLKFFDSINALLFNLDGPGKRIQALNDAEFVATGTGGDVSYMSNDRLGSTEYNFNGTKVAASAINNSIYVNDNGVLMYRDAVGASRAVITSGVTTNRTVGSETWSFINGSLASIT